MLGFAPRPNRKVLITGGAGFIGSNLAAYLIANSDAQITVLDDLSRAGSELNLHWLESQAGPGRLRFVRGDVRNSARVAEAARGVTEIYHLASRCSSDHDARLDFEVNVNGTVNVLEAAHGCTNKPFLLFASTSRVYRDLDCIAVDREESRYVPLDPSFAGVSENMPVETTGPFLCSRGLAEQYVRNYKLPSVIFRADSVAGPRQFADGNDAWVADYVYAALAGKPVTVYGDGLEVRDVLHVQDLVEAIGVAYAYRGVTAGRVYNVGGGMSRSLSAKELLGLVERLCYRPVDVQYRGRQRGDRPFFVSDCWKLLVDTGWMVRRTLEQTVRDLAAFWYADQQAGNEAPSWHLELFSEAA